MTENGETFPSLIQRPSDALRLLPWVTPDGKPCYLSADEGRSMMSRLADNVEEEQISTGEEVLRDALALLADGEAGVRGLRLALKRTAASLGDVLRVEESRGARLPTPDDYTDGEGPRPPATAVG